MSLTQKQLWTRRKGISATDVAAIVGENPWRKAIDVWLEKVSPEPPLASGETEQTKLGHEFEKYITRYYCEKLVPEGVYRRVYEPKMTMAHPEMTWALATPDRYVFECQVGQKIPRGLRDLAVRGKASHLLEVKLVGPRVLGHWADITSEFESEEDVADRIPSYVLTQAQWQMLVTGYRRCDVVAMLGGTKLSVFKIIYNDELVEDLVKICNAFWHTNVLKKIEPDPDGSRSYRDFLHNKYSVDSVVQKLKPALDEAEPMVREYKSLGGTIKELEEQKEKIGQQLKDMVGMYEGIFGPWGKVTWKPSPGRTDYGKIVADLGLDEETLAKYKTPTRTFRVSLRNK